MSTGSTTRPSFPHNERPSVLRRKWRYADAAERFQSEQGRPDFTMWPNARLESIVANPSLDFGRRLDAAVMLTSWGRLSESCVSAMPKVDGRDVEPRLLTQADLARMLNVAPSTVSKQVSRERADKLLYPPAAEGDESVSPDPGTKPALFASLKTPALQTVDLAAGSFRGGNSPPFSEYFKNWLDGHPEEARQIAQWERERDEFRAQAADRSALIQAVSLRALRDRKRAERAAVRFHRQNGDTGVGNAYSTADAMAANGRCSSETDVAAVEVHPQPDAAPEAAVGINVFPTAAESGSTAATQNEPNFNAINETANISYNLKERRVDRSSSSSGSARNDDDEKHTAAVYATLAEIHPAGAALQAAKILFSECRNQVPDITGAEASELIRYVAQEARRSHKEIRNLTGYLMATVPGRARSAIPKLRESIRRQQEWEAKSAREWKEREAHLRERLEDPSTPPDEQGQIRAILALEED